MLIAIPLLMLASAARAETADCPATMGYIGSTLGLETYNPFQGEDPGTFIWAASMFGCQFPSNIEEALKSKGYTFDATGHVVLGNPMKSMTNNLDYPASLPPTWTGNIPYNSAYRVCINHRLNLVALTWDRLDEGAKRSFTIYCKAFAQYPIAAIYFRWKQELAEVQSEIDNAMRAARAAQAPPSAAHGNGFNCQQALHLLTCGMACGFTDPGQAQSLAAQYNANCH
jgi:hypothetical protein